MRFEGFGGGKGGHDGGGGGEGVACYEDVLVGGAAAFGGYYVGEVGGCYFVDYADETFVPAGFVVGWWVCGGWRGRLFGI